MQKCIGQQVNEAVYVIRIFLLPPATMLLKLRVVSRGIQPVQFVSSGLGAERLPINRRGGFPHVVSIMSLVVLCWPSALRRRNRRYSWFRLASIRCCVARRTRAVGSVTAECSKGADQTHAGASAGRISQGWRCAQAWRCACSWVIILIVGSNCPIVMMVAWVNCVWPCLLPHLSC
jgi:hypothetical protein